MIMCIWKRCFHFPLLHLFWSVSCCGFCFGNFLFYFVRFILLSCCVSCLVLIVSPVSDWPPVCLSPLLVLSVGQFVCFVPGVFGCWCPESFWFVTLSLPGRTASLLNFSFQPVFCHLRFGSSLMETLLGFSLGHKTGRGSFFTQMQTENLLFPPHRRPDTRRLPYLRWRYLRWLEMLFKAYFTERFGDIPTVTVSTVCVDQTDISSSSSVRQLWATWTHTAVHKHTHQPD